MKPCVIADSLGVARGGRALIEGLSFQAGAGDFVELSGANGSGKTSLLRALAGFLAPRAGRIEIKAATEPAMALHYLGHLNGLKAVADPRAHVRYWAGLFGVSCEEDAVLDRVGLARWPDLPARALSQGQARRLALARLIIAPRPIWLLDEPAAALDAEGRSMLADLIATHRADGGLVIAAVHEPLGPKPTHSIALTAAP